MAIDQKDISLGEPEAVEKTTDQGIQLLERDIQLKNGEKIKFCSTQIERMRLYHGSPVAGIEVFKEAEEETIGSGVYLTSFRDAARGYGLQRTADHPGSTPVLYETEITNLNILSLTTPAAVTDFMKFFRQELFVWRREVMPTKPWDERQRMNCDNAIFGTVERIDGFIAKKRCPTPKDILQNCGSIAREILMKDNFDGITAMEGGEHGTNPLTGEVFDIGDHDSYVIFQPEKVKILGEEKLNN